MNVKVNAVPWVAVAVAALIIDGAWSTVNVNFWVTVENELAAEMVSEYTPPWPTPAVPARLAVPLPLSTQLSPCGRAPASVNAGAGAPVAFTVKLNADPTVAVADAAVVIAGGPVTVSVNDWVTVPLGFVAVNVIG